VRVGESDANSRRSLTTLNCPKGGGVRLGVRLGVAEGWLTGSEVGGLAGVGGWAVGDRQPVNRPARMNKRKGLGDIAAVLREIKKLGSYPAING